MTRHETLHNYLLQKKQGCIHIHLLCLCSQTHSFIVPFKPCNKYLQCEELKYNYAPSNTIKIHVRHPLQYHGKTNKL